MVNRVAPKRLSIALQNNNVNKDKDIRLALIDRDDDGEYAVDFENLVQSMSAFTNFTRTVYKWMPFKRDVREIQASFGGAAGAYFNFFRWMYGFLFMHFSYI